MKRAILGLVIGAGLAGAANAAPVTVVRSVVMAGVAGGTVAVAPSARLSGRALEALTAGLRAAGYRVVEPDQNPDLLVSWREHVAPIDGPYYTPQPPIQDNYRRDVVVLAWRAGAQPDAASTVWRTRLRSDGLSNREADFLPAMFREGGRGYGREVAASSQPPPS